MQLGAPKRCIISDSDGIGTIIDDDYAGKISISDTSVLELNSGQKVSKVQVSLSPAPLHDVSVNYKTGDDSAKASKADYITTKGTLLFSPGRLVLTVAVLVVGDPFFEADEKFLVRLSAPGIAIAKSLGTITIRNDDTAPLPPPFGVSISDASVTEGDNGTSQAQLAVTLDKPAVGNMAVLFSTSDGSATAPGDYTATSGTLNFASGQTTATLAVPVVGDSFEEADETLGVQLAAPGGLTGDTSGTVTVRDNDYAGTVSIADASVTEGHDGTQAVPLPITLSSAPLHPLSLHLATQDGTATAPTDYTATQGDLLVVAGQTTATFSVPVVGDGIEEADESFSVQLSAPGGIGVNATSTVTILDNDYAGQISIADASALEGNSGQTLVSPVVSLSTPPLHPITFLYATQEGTAKPPGDYITASGGLKFATGQTTATLFVPIVGDTLEEADETFSVQIFDLGNNGRGMLRATGMVTIHDDDYPGTASIANASVSEGDSGQTLASLTVTLSTPPLQPLELVYATSDGTAVAPGDYSATSGTLRFAAGQTTATILIPILGDTEIESSETLKLELSGAKLSVPRTATLTILNDDTVLAALSGKIVFDSSRNGKDQIYAMNADGTSQTRLTNNAASDTAAAWSPDGKRIVFESDRDGNAEIYVMNADGSGQTRLTNNAAQDSSPAC